MDGIFTLPYSEYEAINQVQKLFKKSDGFAVFIPVHRQQKGIDFIIMNTRNGKSLRVQVKGSRSYTRTAEPKRSKKANYKYGFWFNNFRSRYTSGAADLYLLFGLYPAYDPERHSLKTKRKIWSSMVLAFTDKEMKKFLSEVKTKGGKEDRFFGISFNDPSAIYANRGFSKPTDITPHLLKDRMGELLESLVGETWREA